MAIIKCKMCGGDIELSADKTFGTCDSCGSTMTFPKVDDDQRAAAFNRGNHFRRIGEFDKALAVYERIVQEDDTDAEAHWCCALCRFGIEYVEDPETYEWLPTCHRASFDSFLEDVDYLAAVEHSDGITRRQYRKEAAKIAEVQKGILATSQSEEPFDIFICYKESDENGDRTRDSILAQDIYYQLTEQGRRVFFARITLEDKAGAQYEPYIFAALHSARVMVVVGTKPEHFSAVWVKNEWSRFLALMRKDHTKLLLPCYRDMDPYDLPEQLSVLQSYDMSKIGFVQDLTRGVSKVLDAQRPEEPVKETVVVQPQATSSLTALLKRGKMALEDQEWQNADKYFDRALDLDAECAEAYVGKYLVEWQALNPEEFLKKRLRDTMKATPERREAVEENKARIQAAVERYAIEGYLTAQEIAKVYDFDRGYSSVLADRQNQCAEMQEEFDTDKNMSKAMRFAKDDYKAKLESLRKQFFDELEARIAKARAEDEVSIAKIKAAYEDHLNRADAKAAELRKQADGKREEHYQEICQRQEEAECALDFKKVCDAFLEMGDYADCPERAKHCEQRRDEILEAARVAKEKDRQRVERQIQERIRKERRIKIILLSVLVVAIAVSLVSTKVILPFNHYRTAEQRLANGDYAGAVTEFEAAGSYMDAADRLLEAHYAYADMLWTEGDYAGAVKEFEAAGSYMDAADRLPEVYYAYADALCAEGDSAKAGAAAVAFGKAGSYQDAADRSSALWDEIAERSTIGSGSEHTVGLKSDGTVVAVGDNYKGQRDVFDWTDIVAVSTGYYHTVGLKSDGTVVAVGSNGSSQCNVSDWTDIVAVSAGGLHTVGLKSDGTVVAVGKNEDGQCNVSDWTDIVAVSAGSYHTVGLKSDGTVVAVSENKDGQCDVSNWTDIVAVSAGYDHTVGLKEDGTVVAVGDNHWGQCEVSNWTDIVAVSAGFSYTVGLKSDGTAVAVGDNYFGECKVSDWTDIVAVSAGEDHTVGLKSDGTVFAVGKNWDDQCDVSEWKDIKLPN